MHVERGYPWSHTLQRTLDLCRAFARGPCAATRGPRNKAPAVDLELVAKAKALKSWAHKKNRLAFPKESFLFASIWILREDELENRDVSDVKVEDKL